MGARRGGAGASARTWAIDVGGCRTWGCSSGLPAFRYRVDGVGAMRVCCCDAAFDGGLRFDANLRCAKRWAAADARTECARPTGTREVYRGLLDLPWRPPQATARAGCSIFSHRPHGTLDSRAPRAAEGLSRTRSDRCEGKKAALARPHTNKPHLCSTQPTGELPTQPHQSAPSSPLAR